VKKTAIAIVLTAACLVCQFCEKDGPLTKADVEKLLQRINRNSMGFKIEAAPSGISTSPADNGFNRIVLEGATFSFDPTVFYRAIDPKLDLKETTIAMPCGETELTYHAGEDRLNLVALRDMDADWNMLEMFGPSLWKQTDSSPNPEKIRFRIKADEMTFVDHNISALLAEEPLPVWPLLHQLIRDNPESESRVRGLLVEMEFSGMEGKDAAEDFSFAFTCERASGKQMVAADFISLLFPFDKGETNLSELLNERIPLFELNLEIGKSLLKMNRSGASPWEAGIESAAIGYSLKPAEEEDMFQFDLGWAFKGLEATVPENSRLERLLNFRHLDFQMSLARLSQSFLTAYFDFVRETQALRHDKQSQEKIQAVSAKTMQVAGAFFTSQPRMDITLAVEHHFGKLQGESSFQFAQMAQPPIGAAKAVLYDLKGIETKLADGSGLDGQTAEAILGAIRSIFVPDEEGNGRMTFEIKKEAPWSYSLNGRTIPFLSTEKQ
jgi:hypothetical protein